MAITPLNTIKNWFLTHLVPTQQQFWDLLDSLRHKSDKVPAADVDGLDTLLLAKASQAVVDAHLIAADAHAALFAAKEDKTNKGAANGYAPLDNFSKVLSQYLMIVDDLVTGGSTNLLSAEQGRLLQVQIVAINTLLTSNDINLDTVQEVVDAIKTVQTSLSTILVNDLTTGGTTKALTAEMGKTLKALIDGLVIAKATDAISGTVKTDVTKADPVVYTVETADNLLKAKVNAILEIKPITGIAYTLIAYDTENLVQLAYDGTLPMTVTIPNDATFNLPVGSIFYTVGSNTGALTIAGGAGVTFQTAVGLTAGQNETRKYVKKAANTWQVEGGAQPMAVGGAKIYKTYFVNTSTGNNTTGVYEDSTKPYASIDYVAALPAFKENDIIWLQNEGGTFPLNGVLPAKNLSIVSDGLVTLDLSANANTNFYYCEKKLSINLPRGVLYNNRSGGTGAKIATPNSELYLFLKVNEVYWNVSNLFFDGTYMELYVNKISLKNSFAVAYVGMQKQTSFDLVEVVCLGTNVTLLAMSQNPIKKIRIGLISGTGNFKTTGFDHEIGNITTTASLSIFSNVKFMNSAITTSTGIDLFAKYVTISGVINSCPLIKASASDQGGAYTFFKDFSANLGAGQLFTTCSGFYFENCYIKSTNSPIVLNSNGGTYGWAWIDIRNSVFEVVNAVPLVTGGAGQTVAMKVVGISSNCTVLSDQSGTGVTVTQFTNY
ncbi:hypothetical protein [Flavobacterium sp. UBA6046]|jgi:hypothetical protein|uniref:hypothetical protein n=1 Tax=Flavobacterium sp. UBA6046 TaxID=1946552 RepID=UPI0025B830DB|nr:hypothetical protein [Flavobacterium sp. UBA6046]